jgi:hypothetical protein
MTWSEAARKAAADARRRKQHESVSAMKQQDKVAARLGMTTEQYKKKMAADRRAQTTALKKSGQINPFKRRPSPGKGN